jgi:hypothetical protein
MKTTIAILTLSIASAFAQKPVPTAPKPATTAGRAAVVPPATRPATAQQPGVPKKPEPDILDLKPTIVKFEEDGLFMPKICLRSPKARVLFSEPNSFKLKEDAPVFTLVCKDDAYTTLHLLGSGSPLLPLDTEDKKKAVRQTILATAPKDADRVEIISEGENPFPINGWTTYQFTMSYGRFGETFKKQVVFVKLHQFQELQFIGHAPDRFFPKVTGALGNILNSWYREPLNILAATQAKPERD